MPKRRKPAPPELARLEFAKRLQTVRMAAGYETMKSFAEALGVEAETYRRWERGETEPGIFHLREIARVGNVSFDYLIGGRLPTSNESASA